MTNERYSDFANSIDVDKFMEAIGFYPEGEARGFLNGHCPDPWDLHKNGDTTGKFGVHAEDRYFKCFVCGGGSLLSLYMAVKEVSEEEAIDALYAMSDEVDASDEDFLSEIDKILAVEHRQKKVWPYFNENVLNKWQIATDSMVGSTPATRYIHQDAVDWLHGRGISTDVAKSLRIGYDPEHVRRSKSKGEYVGPAIIMPHFWGGRLVGWQSRWLDKDRPKWVPKYTNTRDFPREETLHGYEDVYLSKDPIVVVESVATRYFLASMGVLAVATFGSDVTQEQIRLLRKCQQGVILAPDNDAPGRKWTRIDRKQYQRRTEVKTPMAAVLAQYVPVCVTAPAGELDSGADLGDLVGQQDELLRLLMDADYYYNQSSEQ